MGFCYRYRIRFRDTDAAGVVFFANLFSICHDAYEASLLAASIDVQPYFQSQDLAVPIVYADCKFFRPMLCGELYDIELMPMQQETSEFTITYEISKVEDASGPDVNPKPESKTQRRLSAKALTRHVAIHPGDRQRVELPPMLLAWIDQWRL